MVAKRKYRLVGVWTLGVTGFLACVIVILAVWRGSSSGARRYRHLQRLDDDLSSAALDGDTESRIVAFCADCHAMPSADGFPRQRWHYDLDLIVAEFGHYHTGGIFLLRNVAAAGESPRFESQELDPRPGTIHLPVHDFNRDGRPDFVALVSQEYECVDLFVNQGDAKFNLSNLWAGPDLTFGSSGIELADMDQDGDLDILYTNGDTFDNSYANPSHGVQWLENLGDLQFAYHRLADVPGAYRALAGDMDLDGDSDIIVAAWLPQQVRPLNLRAAPLASILCLEQTSPGRFVRHTLETGSPRHATLEMADFDNDGDLDFAAGSQLDLQGTSLPGVSPIAVWWNQVIPAAE